MVMVRLGVNIDHIATLRNARGEGFPNVVEAACVAETHGADLITVHLREDRRHIKDQDVVDLRQNIKTQLNFEMAVTSEMLDFALQIKPDFVCLVPERRQELTTEGGLNVLANFDKIHEVVTTLQANNILVSIFIDPNLEQIQAASATGAHAIEIHTGKYAQSKNSYVHNTDYYIIKEMSEYAHELNLIVNAGHGLNYHNVQAIAKLPHINDLNIGFAIIAQSVFIGLPKAIHTMKKLLLSSRYT